MGVPLVPHPAGGPESCYVPVAWSFGRGGSGVRASPPGDSINRQAHAVLAYHGIPQGRAGWGGNLRRYKMNEQLQRAIEQGQLALFLGAGASFGCETSTRQPLKMAAELAKTLADESGLPYEDESLDAVYEAARGIFWGLFLPSERSSPSSMFSVYMRRQTYFDNMSYSADGITCLNSRSNISSRRFPSIPRACY